MRLFFLPVVLLLNSCLYLRTTSQVYEAAGPAPSVGGARFRAEFIPLGSEAGVTVSAMVVGGATITQNGPYRLRLHAFGSKGGPGRFRVTRFVLHLPERQDAPMDPQAFEGWNDFQSTSNGEITRASLVFGTKVYINTEHRDRELTLEADVEVDGSRGTIRIPMSQTKKARGETHFIPAEIMKSFRGSTPADIPNALPPPPDAP